MLGWMVVAAAWAGGAARPGPVGFWHPDDLAPVSKRFVSSSERLQEPFGVREGEADRVAAALRQYREALDLLGSQAPAAERERLEKLQTAFQREHAVLQAFADRVIEDYDTAFVAAVQRAVEGVDGEVMECEARVMPASTGPRIPGMKPQSEPNPDCVGEDLNAKLAAVVDADPELAAAIEEILGRKWPVLTVAAEPQAPIGSGERWLRVRDLMVAGAQGPLRAIDRADDEARLRFEAAIEDGATPEQLAALEPEAQKVTDETAAARAALAAPVLEAAAKAMSKWKGEAPAAWCANPEVLGGCTGTDASRELVGRLVDDKRVQKAFPE
ncbi:MAG: hypothetical protein H6738_05200 [Alphaproteobacteria bacterium]|nr:hypothetical protein [Alphaproteobacteria bacterium]MCB9696163.1 hypothetical protein [Alphaproteobacteria bacterium]